MIEYVARDVSSYSIPFGKRTRPPQSQSKISCVRRCRGRARCAGSRRCRRQQLGGERLRLLRLVERPQPSRPPPPGARAAPARPSAVAQRERDRLGRGPGERPVAGRDREPDAAAGREAVADRVQPHGHFELLAGHHASRARHGTRWQRLSWPRVTSSDAPSGAPRTAGQRRAPAGGRSDSTSRASPKPRISSGSARGSEVKVSERASSPRWSSGRSAERPSAHQAPPSRPTVWTLPIELRPARDAGSPSVPSPSASARGAIRGEGHAALATQRPGSLGQVGARAARSPASRRPPSGRPRSPCRCP